MTGNVFQVNVSKVNVFFFSQGHCTDASLMLQVKNLIMLFSHTLRVGRELFVILQLCECNLVKLRYKITISCMKTHR